MERIHLDTQLIMHRDFALRNKNGDEMCHHVGCRKHTRLISKYNGLFCKAHVKDLDEIRTELDRAKRTHDRHKEDVGRQREIEFRKLHEKGHMYWKLKLERHLESL